MVTNSRIYMELTSVQRDILTALINIHRKDGRAVKGEEIAELIDRNPGTIRNQMQSLKALNLVEGVPGPKGGYKATGGAYEAMNLDTSGKTVEVAVVRNGVMVEGTSVNEIIFNKVMQQDACGGVVRITGNIRQFNIGDVVEVGPTPVNRLYIRGKVTGRDDTMSQLIFHVDEMISVPRIPVKDVARRAVRIPPEATLREASRILVHNGVMDALVEENPPGLVNLTDIARAVADGRIDVGIKEIMNRSYLTMESEELIYEAIKILARAGINQVVVTEKGVPWGIVSPEDLMKSLTP